MWSSIADMVYKENLLFRNLFVMEMTALNSSKICLTWISHAHKQYHAMPKKEPDILQASKTRNFDRLVLLKNWKSTRRTKLSSLAGGAFNKMGRILFLRKSGEAPEIFNALQGLYPNYNISTNINIQQSRIILPKIAKASPKAK